MSAFTPPPLCEMCLNTEFFLSVFSCIWTEYGEILCITPYLARMRGKYGPEETPYLDTFHAVLLSLT